MRTQVLTAAMILMVLAASSLSAATKPLQATPVVIPKETGNAIDVVKRFLTPRAENGMVKIWVFFTDKNIFADNQFAEAASSITLTDAARARRAKVGLDHITFGDLPVYRGYIEQVSSFGATLRRTSRWLNAASFRAPLAALDAINDLPFVAKVRPVAVFVREPVETSPLPEGPVFGAPDKMALDYGISFGQLNQINVPAVHNKGFNGSGVIVAMFDTGYLKDHEAFATAYTEGRVLAEWDFIFDDGNTQNEAEDSFDQHRHGTLTWSALGGQVPGVLYGPAYGASFILAKTEYVPTETQVEEDNWAAAVEWADSIGAGVISSSLSYSDWYTYNDYDGSTAVTTIAANAATAYGIVVANSMGNSGPEPGTLGAPADAFEILSVGAVYSSGTIAGFSSRGPTADGRIKPEVCAQGVSTYSASASSLTSYTYASGTSLSCPLTAGCAAVLLSARPSLTPQTVLLALMLPASKADYPDNTYGWGIIDLDAALGWGANFTSNVKAGSAPLTVNFNDSSYVPTTDWDWNFGDGETSTEQNPVHTYDTPGIYDVSLTVTSDGLALTDSVPDYIFVHADTITYVSDSVYAGNQAVIDVEVINSYALKSLTIPFDFSDVTIASFDSFSVAGTRADGFLNIRVGGSVAEKKLAIMIQNTANPLQPGSGPVLRFYFKTDSYAFGGSAAPLDTSTIAGYYLEVGAVDFDYAPDFYSGEIVIRDVMRGDANHDDMIAVGDPVYMINHVFKGGPAPITFESGDANMDYFHDVGDAVYLIEYIFKDGPAPPDSK